MNTYKEKNKEAVKKFTDLLSNESFIKDNYDSYTWGNVYMFISSLGDSYYKSCYSVNALVNSYKRRHISKDALGIIDAAVKYI